MAVTPRPRREERLRTHDFVVHEELGLALGRMAMAEPAFRDALTLGYTNALREHAAGKRVDVAEALRAFGEASDAMAKLHDAPKRPRARARGRR